MSETFTKECSRCMNIRPLSDFISLRVKKITKDCTNCRELSCSANKRRLNMISTEIQDGEKICTRCITLRSVEHFVVRKNTLTKICKFCYDYFGKYKKKLLEQKCSRNEKVYTSCFICKNISEFSCKSHKTCSKCCFKKNKNSAAKRLADKKSRERYFIKNIAKNVKHW